MLKEQMNKLNECAMGKLGTLDSSERTIAILGDRWWPQTAKLVGSKMSKKFPCNIWKNVMSAHMLQVSLLSLIHI